MRGKEIEDTAMAYISQMAQQVEEARSPELTALIDMAHLCTESELPRTHEEHVEQLWKAFGFGQQREGWREKKQ